jgi:hypothetical protein
MSGPTVIIDDVSEDGAWADAIANTPRLRDMVRDDEPAALRVDQDPSVND